MSVSSLVCTMYYTAFVFLFVTTTVQLVSSDMSEATPTTVSHKNGIPRDHRYFLHQIFRKYGYNGFISFEGFEHLLESLGLGHLKFNTSHTISHHKNADGVFQEMHDEHHIHDHEHHRAARNTDKGNTGKTEEQLNVLLQQHDEEVVDYSELKSSSQARCLSTRELLIVYGLQPDHRLSLTPLSFLHLCPAIIYELDQRSCSDQYGGLVEEPTVIIITPEHRRASWLYATAAVTLISISGLLSVAIVPFFQKTFFTQLLNFLVALAVGTLCGDALLHLLPHALLSHDKNDTEINVVLRSGVVFLVIAVFFFTEALMKAIKNNKEKKLSLQDKGYYTSVDLTPDVKEEEMSAAVEMKTVEPKATHQHGHSHKVDSISSVAVMVITGDALHNLTDGLAIGAAFSGGIVPGFATAVAVFTHELPHELGDFAVLLQSGLTVKQALFYNIVSSVLSFIGTFMGLWLGNFSSATQWIYAITAGSFIYIALADLIPEMNKSCTSGLVNISHIFLQLCGILSGGAIMCTIAIFEEDLYNIFSS